MAEMTAATIVSELKSELAGFCTEKLSDYMQVVRADLLDNAARMIEQQAEEIEKRDRMIEKIYKPIKECDCNGEKAKCDVLDSFEEYYQIDKGISPWDLCEYYWLCEIAWLEKEAEGVE